MADLSPENIAWAKANGFEDSLPGAPAPKPVAAPKENAGLSKETIAWAKANGYEVPKEYLNEPEPEKKVEEPGFFSQVATKAKEVGGKVVDEVKGSLQKHHDEDQAFQDKGGTYGVMGIPISAEDEANQNKPFVHLAPLAEKALEKTGLSQSDNTAAKVATGITRSVAKNVDNFATPRNVNYLALGGAPGVGPAMAAVFAPMMAKGAYDSGKAAINSAKSGDVAGTAENATSAFISGALGGIAAGHVAGAVAPSIASSIAPHWYEAAAGEAPYKMPAAGQPEYQLPQEAKAVSPVEAQKPAQEAPVPPEKAITPEPTPSPELPPPEKIASPEPVKEAVGDIGGGKPPESGLVVANIGADGKIYYGEPGDLHFNIAEKFPHDMRGDWKDVGFAGPDGKFLTRQEALDVANQERPLAAKSSSVQTKGLDALDYNEAKPPVIEPEKSASVNQIPEEHRAELEALYDEIKTAEAGKRIFLDAGEGRGGDMDVRGQPSTFPIKDLGSKADQLRTIDKVLNGKELTNNQAYIYDRMKEHLDDLRSYAAARPIEAFTPDASLPYHDYTLRAEIFPGANWLSKVVQTNIIKPIKTVIGLARDAKRYLTTLDDKPPEADIAKGIMREGFSTWQQAKDAAWDVNKKTIKWFDQFSPKQKFAFMDNVERGTFSPEAMQKIPGVTPEVASDLSSSAKMMREMLENAYKLDTSKDANVNYLENYFPHIWEDPAAAAKFITSQIKKLGKQGYMKERYYDLIAEGLKNGLKLKTDNPMALVTLRQMAGFQNAMTTDIVNSFKSEGLIKFNQGMSPPPEGFAKLDHPYFTRIFPKSEWKPVEAGPYEMFDGEQKTLAPAGYYMAPEPVAKAINNWLSPSMWSRQDMAGSIFRGFMNVKNTVVSLKLGLSLFHAINTGFSSIASRAAVGMERIIRGDMSGLQDVASSAFAPVTQALKGGDLVNAWYKDPSTWTKDQAYAMDLMKRGGFRPKMSEVFRAGLGEQIKQATTDFRNGHVIGGTLKFLPALTNVISKPILEWFVPRLKTMSYVEAAGEFMDKNPDLQGKALNVELGKIADSIDNRFGQMAYDNLFWNRYVRDIGVASTLSMGWNLGTLREFGGAAKDLVKFTGTKGKAGITNRLAFAAIYPIVVGTFGGLMTYAKTGKPPSQLLDYFYPRSGKTNQDGTAERYALPSMMKEFYGIKEHLRKEGPLVGGFHYFTNKLTPIISNFIDLARNHDYFNQEIRDEHAPVLEQAKQVAAYVGMQLAPLSLSAAQHQKEQTGKASPLSFLGISPAPGYITRSPLQNEIFDLYEKRFSGGIMTQEDADKMKAKRNIRELFRTGQTKDADKALYEAEQKGYITPKGWKSFSKTINEPGDVRAFKRLPEPDQVYLLSKMSRQELLRYWNYTPRKSQEAYYLSKQKKSQPSKEEGAS